MAALALGSAIGLDMKKMLRHLKVFQGLEHRCELVCKVARVSIYNDSKATNVASCEAAIRSFGRGKNIVLILGGTSKNTDFSPLKIVARDFVKQAVAFGAVKEEIVRQHQPSLAAPPPSPPPPPPTPQPDYPLHQ